MQKPNFQGELNCFATWFGLAFSEQKALHSILSYVNLFLKKSIVLLFRERKAVNFDNPVYRRTTEDSVPIMDMVRVFIFS